MSATPLEFSAIDAGRHPVFVGRDVLKALDAHLADTPRTAVFILGDENTLRHCLPELLARVPQVRRGEPIGVPAGEASKSLPVCQEIWSYLTARAADKQALLVCLGGGVVSDLGGFIAGTYKRGIRCVHVPTSLMAMVDAAIGGKSGIDLAGIKNVVGLYHDPLAVYLHTPFLKSLGKRDLLNGLAEMLKHGIVRDADHFEAICAAPLHDLDALAELVYHSAAIKAAVVKEDPWESGPRKALNFGHSIGHGLEAFSWEGSQRALLHGEAVAAGMLCEAWLSWRMGLLDRAVCDRIAAQVQNLYRPYPLDDGAQHRIVELMRNDKKNHDGQFRLSLPTALGSVQVDVPATAAQVLEAVEHYRLLVKE